MIAAHASDLPSEAQDRMSQQSVNNLMAFERASYAHSCKGYQIAEAPRGSNIASY